MLYYEDYDTLSKDTRRLMQQSMAAFGGNAPSYHIALLDKPTIIWDFHPLLLGIQMMFSFMLTTAKIRSAFAGTARKPLSQAGRAPCFAARSARISTMFTRAGTKKRNRTMIDGMVIYNG